MLKLILFILVLYIIYLIFFKKKSSDNKDIKKKSRSEEMIECENCGTFTSVNEIIKKGGHHFCSRKCAKDKK